jgi:hypothetical protein
VNGPDPASDYDAQLYSILEARDWERLREFSREHNAIPDDVYEQPQHFWEVMLHKLICNRFDLLGLHAESRAWLSERGYSTDVGDY